MLTIPLDGIAPDGWDTADVEVQEGLRAIVRRIRTAKKVVVVCGAGISTATGIPDFRSSGGLFNQDSGRGKGKAKAQDLFHVRSLHSSSLLPQHHELLNELASLSTAAEPSAFHSYLATLDREGRLLRCYTQNIDGLEARAGLEVGLPAVISSKKSPRKKTAIVDTPPSPSSSPVTPRCIPLHGQLTHLFCPLCSTVVPLASHLPLPPNPIPCPTCDLSSSIRHALSERQRKVGALRASVVLYGEEHPQGESIGSVVERDLRGTARKGEKREGKVDLLLVVGTSLAIPGVKRIVKEMASSLRARSGLGSTTDSPGTPSPSRGRGRSDPRPQVIMINREMPKGSEWEGVFDTFISGDIQQFTTRYLINPDFVTPEPPKTPRSSKKRKAQSDLSNGLPPTPGTTPSKIGREAHVTSLTPSSTPSKKLRGHVVGRLPPTPRPTPPSKYAPVHGQPKAKEARRERSGDDSPLTPVSEDENPFLVAR